MDKKIITFDKFIRWSLIVLGVVAFLFAVNYLSSVLLPFAIAWFLAYLVYPVVRFVQYRLKVCNRAVSIIITMLLLIGVLVGVFWLIIPPMLDQVDHLIKFINKYINTNTSQHDITSYVRQWLSDNQKEINDFLNSEDFSDAVKAVAPRFVSFLGETASVIVSIVASCITLLYMFFILLDYEFLTENWIKIFPVKSRPFWNELAKDTERELNNYIRGQCLVALCMGIMFCIGFTIIDFPMAIGLGVLIGILDLVPYLHTFALIPTAFLALLKAADTGQNFWMIFGLAVLVFAVVQVITDMVVTPKVMGKQMGLNPAILLLSLSIWGALLGFIGLIIALPLTTLIMAYWQRYVTKEHEKTVPETSTDDATSTQKD